MMVVVVVAVATTMMKMMVMMTKNGTTGQQQTNRKNEWRKFLGRCARVASHGTEEKQLETTRSNECMSNDVLRLEIPVE